MLTASIMRSQDTTDVRPVTFPFWMAKEIAIDLNNYKRLQALQEISDMEVAAYIRLTKNLQEITSKQALQMDLLKSNNSSLEKQLEIWKTKKELPLFAKWLIGAGAFLAGYFVGSAL